MTGEVDLARLSAWLCKTGVSDGEIREVVPLAGGTQNVMYRLDVGGSSLILRHPPRHKRASSDRALLRETRVLGALGSTDVPHPRLVAVCDDLDVLGSVFYLMECVPGINATVRLPDAYGSGEGWLAALSASVVDALAAIAKVDYAAIGLGDLGRPEGFLERQVDRWWSELEGYHSVEQYEPLDAVRWERVASWLRDHRPVTWSPGLMHGDFHLANLICHEDRPAVAAVVDWELATLGDPLVDLGWLVATWPGETKNPRPSAVRTRPHVPLPQAGDLVARYAERTGRDVSAIGWYETFACYKLAVLLEGTVCRAAAGRAPAKIGSRLRVASVDLLEKAAHRIAADGDLALDIRYRVETS
jgi:aminoglycoside phosphotransferase (APT) family kinase protein